MSAVAVLVGALLTALLVLFVLITIFETKRKKQQISFKDAMELTELPIVTFYCGDVKLHFLLDSGSNQSVINSDLLNTIEYENTNKRSELVGMEGNLKIASICRIKIKYKNEIFEENFVVNDLSKTFDIIKRRTGVQIHGILGTNFFNKYKYIIDFNELVAYSAK